MRWLKVYNKEQRLKLMNQSLCQAVLTTVEHTIEKDGEQSYVRCAEVIQSVVPECSNISVNPIRFDVMTSEGVMSVVFKDGVFSED